ncbi:hypothetical protein [Pseudoduganella lutea]|uniref:Uncharacterized protein n=1 Tax=Pseudoduganella lutea TaxID=321985 RepID=A0A4P6KV68_9BURK|nr:hypothetical protein [Pseudoduganella lutea]QBE63019.1 hypothetical protein EWM63_08570 [Pseudoduganella lutea]
MMPTDRLTIRSTTFDSSVKENNAAAEMLATPASVVASRIEMSTGSILEPLVRFAARAAPGPGQRANRTFYRPARASAENPLSIRRKQDECG